MPENLKSLLKKALTEYPKNVLALCLALLGPADPDLASIVRAWPEISEQQRHRIFRIVQGESSGSEK